MGLQDEGNTDALNGRLNVGQIIALASTLAAIVVVVIGSVQFGWGNSQFAAVFFLVAVIIGLTNGYGVNGTTKEFITGASKMVNAAFIIGFANAISVVLTNGQILNTIVYYLSLPLSQVGPVLGANLMMVINTAINLFIQFRLTSSAQVLLIVSSRRPVP